MAAIAFIYYAKILVVCLFFQYYSHIVTIVSLEHVYRITHL